MIVETLVRVLEAWRGDPTRLGLASDVVFEDTAQVRVYRGREAVRELLQAFFKQGFPAGRLQVERVTADRETITIQGTFLGCHKGPFHGIPPTGREVALPMKITCQVANGEIRQGELDYQAFHLLQQLGLAVETLEGGQP